MCEISEKSGFMKVRAVTVFAKTGIGRKAGHKKRCFHANFEVKLPRKRNFLTV
jgi:hypothetical protein